MHNTWVELLLEFNSSMIQVRNNFVVHLPRDLTQRSDLNPIKHIAVIVPCLLQNFKIILPQKRKPKKNKILWHMSLSGLNVAECTVDLDNGLPPEFYTAITWTNVNLLSIGPLGTKIKFKSK